MRLAYVWLFASGVCGFLLILDVFFDLLTQQVGRLLFVSDVLCALAFVLCTVVAISHHLDTTSRR